MGTPGALRPCDTYGCSAPGVHLLDGGSWCQQHLDTILGPDRPWEHMWNWVPVADGPAPDWPAGYYHLTHHCGAGWYGHPGEWCPWCDERRQHHINAVASGEYELNHAPEYVDGFAMCDTCQRVVADVDEWDICGEHGGKTDEGHYCNGRLKRFTRRTADRRARRAAA